jgi:hypothetical protein
LSTVAAVCCWWRWLDGDRWRTQTPEPGHDGASEKLNIFLRTICGRLCKLGILNEHRAIKKLI